MRTILLFTYLIVNNLLKISETRPGCLFSFHFMVSIAFSLTLSVDSRRKIDTSKNRPALDFIYN
ncbi:hypothetical protein D3C73_1329830 [compost metagenome]